MALDLGRHHAALGIDFFEPMAQSGDRDTTHLHQRGKVMSKWTLYAYKNCSTCKRAEAFLRERGISHKTLPIVDHPPSAELLRLAAGHVGIKKLFNTSGELYRTLNLKDQIGTMSEAEAVRLLSANGKLIKRPLLVSEGAVLVGFKEDEWSNALS